MVEFTEEENARYAERVKHREEKAAKQEKEKETATAKSATKKKGVLERVADKAEGARNKYNNIKTQGGRIKNAIAPAKVARAKRPAAPARHAYSGVSNRRSVSRRPMRVVYQQPVMQPRDVMQDSIMGPSTGRNGVDHLNDMIGLGSGGKGSMDFMSTMIKGSSSGKKKDEFWREMLGK